MVPCYSALFFKYAKVNFFTLCLLVLLCFHCASNVYFDGTAKAWKMIYSIDQYTTSWILHSSDVFIGFLAIFIAYFGNKMHRPAWIGILACVETIAGGFLIMPEFYFSNPKAEEYDYRILCNINYKPEPEETTIHGKVTTISILMLYKICYSLTTISIWAHGLSYFDDHIKMKNIVPHVGIMLIVREFGNYIGLHFSLIPVVFKTPIFQSCVWLLMMIIIFIFGVIIALFPKWLPNRMMEQGVATLLYISEPLKKLTYRTHAPIKRVLSNRVVLLNLAALSLLNTALVNFKLLQQDFFRARFMDFSIDKVTNYEYFFNVEYLANYATHPASILSLIVVMLLMKKYSIHIRKMVMFVLVNYIMIAVLFATFAFIKCDDEFFSTFEDDNCTSHCNCNVDYFEPVCMASSRVTFYSPCFAGCRNFNGSIFTECGCCISEDYAYPGACNETMCASIILLAKTLGILRHSLTTVSYMIHLIIAMRAVAECDKALSIGIFLTFVNLPPYVPMHFIFSVIKDSMCMVATSKGECTTYEPNFAFILSVVTLSIIILAIGTLIPMVYYIGPLNIYNYRWAFRNFGTAFQNHRSFEFTESPNQLAEDIIEPVTISKACQIQNSHLYDMEMDVGYDCDVNIMSTSL